MNAKQRRNDRRHNYLRTTFSASPLRVLDNTTFGPWCDRCWSKVKSEDEQHGNGFCDEAMTLEQAKAIVG
jgi:hypothetical protein